MLFIFLATALWIPPILGFGAVLRYGGDPALRPAVTGALGLAVVAVLSICLNFVAPLSPVASSAAWIVGLALFLSRRRWLFEGASGWDVAIVAGALAGLVLLMQPPLYDAGLYYLQSVKWAAERRMEIGLANLHIRLGTNSAWFPLSAMLEHALAEGRSSFFVTLLPASFAAWAGAASIRRLVAGDRGFATVWFATAPIPIALSAAGIGSHGTDQAVALLAFLIFGLWIHALETEARFAAEARAAILLSAAAVLVKLSALPLLAGGTVVVLVRRRSLPAAWFRATAALLLVAFVPWLARSVCLSGCLVMPVPSSCIPALRWTVPGNEVQAQADNVKAWARAPGVVEMGRVLASWAWLSNWAERNWAFPDVRALASLIAGGALAWLVRARSTRAPFVWTYALAAAGTAFWFWTAPDPRFGFAYLEALALLPIAFVLSRTAALAHVAARALATAAFVAGAAFFVRYTGTLDLALARPLPVPAIEWPEVPTTFTVQRVTGPGYVVRLPVITDQCWASRLPCTPTDHYRATLARDWALIRRPPPPPEPNATQTTQDLPAR